MDNLTQILIGFALSIVASIITAFVTVKLSLSQFRSQRWWERKAETYSCIIEQLSLLEFSQSKYLQIYNAGAKYSEDYENRLREIGRKATESVMQAAASGAYIISEEAAEALKTFREKSEQPPQYGDPWEGLEDEHAAAKKCIEKLRECAKADLKS